MPIIGITVAFLALGSLLVIFSRQHYYSILEEETDNEVRMVTKSLESMLVTRNLFEPSYSALVETKELEGLISGLVPEDGPIVQIVRGEAGVKSGMTEIEGNKFYRAVVPVDEEVLEDSYIVILKPSKETDRKILRSCTIGILILAAVYIALLALMDFTLNRNRHLMMLAYYDHLTGLFNSYYLKVMLTKDLKLYRWNRKALMLIGISNLKSINLLFGYDSGDDALRQLAKTNGSSW